MIAEEKKILGIYAGAMGLMVAGLILAIACSPLAANAEARFTYTVTGTFADYSCSGAGEEASFTIKFSKAKGRKFLIFRAGGKQRKQKLFRKPFTPGAHYTTFVTRTGAWHYVEVQGLGGRSVYVRRISASCIDCCRTDFEGVGEIVRRNQVEAKK